MSLPRYTQWIMKAKKGGNCKETGKKIEVGDAMLYIPAAPRYKIPARIFCKESKEYQNALKTIDTGYCDDL